MASQPSKSLRNDLGRATLIVLPVGYSQNGYSKKGNLGHHYTEDYKSIQSSQNYGKLHACANSSYQAFLFPLPPNAWVRGYSPLHTGDRGPLVATTYTSFACYSRCSNKHNGLPWCTNVHVGYSTVNTHTTHHTRLFRLPLPPTLLQALSTKANSLVGPPSVGTKQLRGRLTTDAICCFADSYGNCREQERYIFALPYDRRYMYGTA